MDDKWIKKKKNKEPLKNRNGRVFLVNEATRSIPPLEEFVPVHGEK